MACALAIEREHGEGAFLHAAMQIDRLDAEGERKAAGVWHEVLKRIEALEGSGAGIGRNWRTDDEKVADEQDEPKLYAEAWLVGALMLAAALFVVISMVW